MIKQFAFLIVFLLFGAIAAAQVPGYLGRKLITQVDLGIAPNLGINDPIYRRLPEIPVAFLNPSVGFGVVFSRMAILGVDFGYSTSKLKANVSSDQGQYLTTGINLKTLEVGLNIKYFFYSNNGRLAPLGTYFKFLGTLKSVSASYLDSTGISSIPKSLLYSGGISIGRNMILADRILLDVGIVGQSSASFDSQLNLDQDNYPYGSGLYRHFGHRENLQLNIGIGLVYGGKKLR